MELTEKEKKSLKIVSGCKSTLGIKPAVAAVMRTATTCTTRTWRCPSCFTNNTNNGVTLKSKVMKNEK